MRTLWPEARSVDSTQLASLQAASIEIATALATVNAGLLGAHELAGSES